MVSTAQGRIIRGTISTLVAVATALLMIAGCTLGPAEPKAHHTSRPSAPELSSPSAPGAAEFPDASSTGVPPGTVLRPTGSLTVTQDGAVIDSVAVTGVISVEADNVTVRRTLVNSTGRYPIRVTNGHGGLLVEDAEIDGQGVGKGAVCCSNYRVLRVDIHDVFEGPRLGDNTAIEDSYVHHLLHCSDCHVDALQTDVGSNVVIRGNNIQAYNPQTGRQNNAAYQFGSPRDRQDEILVEGNLLNGGNYTVNGGGGKSRDAEAVFRDNRFGREFRYGPVANFGPRVSFDSSNVWNDTGAPIVSPTN